ncbi:hypothetical protein VDGD_00153 [Verticillium dahliae]|uniref:Methyltransferase n=1 Tax=Verticillium dahliae (strain VdLs.17 / ATCC MYA-4575 / FGSC 10137) TaxID=498257 RepID=G2WRH0_VERDV|nr:uncharacterized protein VDAG_00153 [Verticillium dahliae VdLs.17]EGY13471.1 hypothetical protein VDAG_00153 [Verticillium dahliae VdLs.17]KAH6709922.1 S-adenosyl-L-methionine-dependent methyltransferase [Verticillium dahliae]RBQ82239.1 hypothetical protein VDGD_00153 [Verticillium dahliae]
MAPILRLAFCTGHPFRGYLQLLTLSRGSESITDSIANFPQRFGRTYHAYQAGSYVFPNDDVECERLELQGLVMTELFGGKWFLAPFPAERPPTRILDVGTGTGIWALEMGDRFPEARVYGIDLSPIQPTAVPSNVHFFVQDASEQWDWREPLDFVFVRGGIGSFANFKEEIVRQAFDNLEPGGWFETQDFNCDSQSDDGTLLPDSALQRWFDDMNAASEIIHRPLSQAHLAKNWLAEVGFVDIHEKCYKIPLNGWAKDPRYKALGKLWEQNWMSGLSGWSMSLFTQVLGRTPEEVEVSLVDVRKDFSNPYIHAYQRVYVVYGRKPFPHEVAGYTGDHEMTC